MLPLPLSLVYKIEVKNYIANGIKIESIFVLAGSGYLISICLKSYSIRYYPHQIQLRKLISPLCNLILNFHYYKNLKYIIETKSVPNCKWTKISKIGTIYDENIGKNRVRNWNKIPKRWYKLIDNIGGRIGEDKEI